MSSHILGPLISFWQKGINASPLEGARLSRLRVGSKLQLKPLKQTPVVPSIKCMLNYQLWAAHGEEVVQEPWQHDSETRREIFIKNTASAKSTDMCWRTESLRPYSGRKFRTGGKILGKSGRNLRSWDPTYSVGFHHIWVPTNHSNSNMELNCLVRHKE